MSDENQPGTYLRFGLERCLLRKQTEICVYKRKSCIDTVESTQGGKLTRAKVWGCGQWGVAGCISETERRQEGRELKPEARRGGPVRDAPMGQEEVFIFRVYLEPTREF